MLVGGGGISLGARCFVGAGAELHGDRAPVRLGADCSIGAGSVLWPGDAGGGGVGGGGGGGGGSGIVAGARVCVGAGARIEARALGDGVSIGAEATVGPRSIICEAAAVSAHSRLLADSFVPPGVIVAAPVRGGNAVFVATLPAACARGLPRGWSLV